MGHRSLEFQPAAQPTQPFGPPAACSLMGLSVLVSPLGQTCQFSHWPLGPFRGATAPVVRSQAEEAAAAAAATPARQVRHTATPESQN